MAYQPKVTQQQAREIQRARYQKALEMVWRKPDNCPICNSTFWNIGDLVNAPLRPVVTDIATALVGEERAYVYAPVTCVYCGYTIFFHTGVLDVRLDETIKTVPPLDAPKGIS